MATTADFAALLQRHADAPSNRTGSHRSSARPESIVLALLAAFLKDAAVVRSWLIATGPAELRSIARDDAVWLRLLASARKHAARTPKAVRRDIARRSVSHVLRAYTCSPSRRRKACILAAALGAQALAETTPRDTILVTQVDLAVRLGITEGTVHSWLRIGVEEGVIREVARARDGRRRFRFRRWPASHEPTEVEKRASASLERGEPNEVAAFILSATHPAWSYDDVLSHHHWEARVRWAAGERSRSRLSREAVAHVQEVDDLALRLDAVSLFAVKWERRQEDAAARKAEALLSREQREKAYAALTALSWPPMPEGLDAWVAQTRVTLAQFPVPVELTTPFNAALRRELTRRFPTEVEQTLTFLREDIFDDHNYAVH